MLILSFFLLIKASFSLKISHLTALLQFKDPRSTNTPHFKISAEGGCFNWKSLNPDIVRVIPNSDTCSTSALVESVATGPIRRSTSIIAESNHNTFLKCDIFIDSVKNISILTTTRSIYLESSLETVSLLAKDSENNVFTSLEGTNIKWKIDKEHLRTISTDEAKLYLPEVMPNKSASLIIQGTKIGKTWVEATLDGIHHATADLNVVKELTFLPFPIIRTLPYHHIPFKLCSARGNNRNFKTNGALVGVTVGQNHISQVEFDSTYCSSQIQLPSDLYKITTSNSRSLIANQSAYATTLEPGESTITATDVSISDNTASTLVQVMYPFKVDQPPQYIALGDDPVFNPILMDKDGNELDIFEPINWFEYITNKGEWKTVGKKNIIFKYHDFQFTAIVYVCPPITMNPPEAILPVRYSGFVVRPQGGSGYYDFSIDDPSVLSYEISNRTYRITTSKEGRTKIYVHDKKIRKFYNFSNILVSKVAYVDIQIEKRELIQQEFQPKCEVFAIEKKRFSVEMKYKTYSTNNAIVSPKMKAEDPGFAEIYCKDLHEGVESEKILVSSADYLKPQVVGRGSPFSAIPLIVTGGVLTWPYSQPPMVEVTCPNANVTNFPYNYFSIDREYSGYCTATMENKKSDLNPFPLKLSQDFYVNVSYVYRFDLYVKDEKASENPDCNAPFRRIEYQDIINDTFRNRMRSYRVITGHLHKILVFPRDINDNIINYYSAVPFYLRTSLGETLHPDDTHGYLDETIYYYTPYKSTDLSVTSPNISKSTTSLIEIKPLKLPPTQIIYYKQNNIYTFPIDAGSGYYSTLTENARFDQGNLQYSPKKEGNQTISINDTCTDGSIQYLNLNAISVETLKIEAPQYVFVNRDFNAKVLAYGQKSIPLPKQLLPEAEISLKPDFAKQLSYDTWRLTPTRLGELHLVATSENYVKAYATVNVIESLIVSPRYIELLPGDRQLLTIEKGPSNILFEHEDHEGRQIADVEKVNNRYYVVAFTPGNITINAKIRNQELMSNSEPCKIYVRVLRPISLILDPTTNTPIQTGYIGLRLKVLTDDGYRIPNQADWNWQIQQSNGLNGYSYVQINKSFAFVNLTTPVVPLQKSRVSDVIVVVKAYRNLKKSLEVTYSQPIEPRLIITTPDLIILPPYCRYQIGILDYGDHKMIHRCIFKPDNDSIISCEGGLIKSYSTEGETTVNVIYGHQKLVIRVRVSNPAFLYLHQRFSSSSDFHIMLLDPYGLLYSSTNGVEYSLSGPTGLAPTIYPKGYCHVEFPSEDEIELHAVAKNSQFLLETSRNVSVKQRISPSNAYLMKGASYKFECTALKPTWSSSQYSILDVQSDGTAKGLKDGEAQIRCGPNIKTKVTVVEMRSLELTNEPNDEFKIHPKYSRSIDPLNNQEEFIFVKPSDLTYECICLETSCASPYYKKKDTGHYCILNQTENSTCSPKAELRVIAISGSNVIANGHTPISSYGNIDFGIPSFSSYTVSLTKLKINIVLKLNQSEVSIKDKPKNIDIEWENDNEFIIRVDPSFTSKANIIVEHKKSGEKATIEIVHETSADEIGSESNRREFKVSKEILFFIALIIMFASITYIIVILTSDD